MCALLHDTIEDTETTAAELEAAFGPEITGIVFEVTDDKSCQRTSANARPGSYFKGGCGILAA